MRPLLCLRYSMRTAIYVDAFNLYFRMLQKRPQYKWLNLRSLCERVLRPENHITAINYYTARVSGRLDAHAPARQQIYLDALQTIPELTIHFGSFLTGRKWAGLVQSETTPFRPHPTTIEIVPWPNVARIIKVEEKGSDVNLASHLVRDAFTDRFDVAAVISNDTDLVEPMRIVTEEVKKPVGLLSPVDNPSVHLRRVSSFVRHIGVRHLVASQFPEVIPGTEIQRPAEWSASQNRERILDQLAADAQSNDMGYDDQ